MNTFYVISMAYYNRAFPIQEVSKSSIYRKQVFNPWMTKGLQKYLKGDRNFTINFLSPKRTKMKRNRRPTNLYMEFLKKSLKLEVLKMTFRKEWL